MDNVNWTNGKPYIGGPNFELNHEASFGKWWPGMPEKPADHDEIIDETDLSTTKVVNAERRISWDSLLKRCEVLAGTLGIKAQGKISGPQVLAKIIGSKLAKLPRENRMWDSEELESSICERLYRKREIIAKSEIPAASAERQAHDVQAKWFEAYLARRSLSTNGIGQAISLQRQEDLGAPIDVPSTAHYEIDGIVESLNVQALLADVPAVIADVLRKLIGGFHLSHTERVRWLRFNDNGDNKANIFRVLTGDDVIGDWRMGKRGRPQKQAQNLIVTV